MSYSRTTSHLDVISDNTNDTCVNEALEWQKNVKMIIKICNKLFNGKTSSIADNTSFSKQWRTNS